MTDPKKNPNKRRRSFFWRRRPQLPLEPPKPAPLEDGVERGSTLVPAHSAEGVCRRAWSPRNPANPRERAVWDRHGRDPGGAIQDAVADEYLYCRTPQDNQPVRAKHGEV